MLLFLGNCLVFGRELKTLHHLYTLSASAFFALILKAATCMYEEMTGSGKKRKR
jgi:hypothetical protein